MRTTPVESARPVAWEFLTDWQRSLTDFLRRGSSPAFRDEEKQLPEELRQFLDAFSANQRTAAGRRMQYFLRKSGNGAVAGTGTPPEQKTPGEQRSETALQFLVVTDGFYSYRERMLASTALEEMALLITKRNESLKEQIAQQTVKFLRLSEQLEQSETDLSQTRLRIEEKEKLIAETGEQAAQIDQQAAEVSEESIHHYSGIAAMENRTIRIVRPLETLCEFRKSMMSEETDAPDIYIATGQSEDGKLLFDKVTMDEEGQIIIERVTEDENPEALKDKDGMYTDMIERVFYRPAEDGENPFVRMEHGFNGSLMGEIGTISQDMITQYLAATGKFAADLTTDAAAFEEKVKAQYGYLDEIHATHDRKSELQDKINDTLASLEGDRDIYDEIRQRTEQLALELETAGQERQALEEELRRREELLEATMQCKARVDSMELADARSVLRSLLPELQVDFISHYQRAEEQHGVAEATLAGMSLDTGELTRMWAPIALARNDIGRIQRPEPAPAPMYA